MDPTYLHILAAVMVVVGIAGTVLPLLPGVVLIFAGLVVAAWADGFTRVGGWGIGVLAVLAALAFLADFLGSALGAKKAGASPLALVGATVGAVAGLLFGIPGLILGPFAGAVAGEFIARRKLLQAGKVGIGTWLGLLFAAVTKLIIAFLMIATFFAFYLMN
jgi:uncharacterized protein